MRFVVSLINRSAVSYQHQELCLQVLWVSGLAKGSCLGWRGGGDLTLAMPEILPD